MKNEFRALVAEKADQRLGFSDVLPTRCIGDLQGEELCILYGVVVRFTPARKTRGTDHLVSVVLTDPTMPSRSDGLSINFFNAAAMLPPVEQVGDILKCSVKVQRYGSKLQGISPKFSYYVALLTQADAPDLDATDLKIRALLSSWWNSSAEANTFSVPLMPKPARPTLKIADIVTHDIFCDIIAQVIAVYPLAGRSVRILVSDFTSNDRIQKPNSVPESVAYPLELITVLTCYLWDANADEGATLLPGDYVTLKNARIKLGELGLEAALHGDRDFSRKCNVFKLAENDPVVAGIRNDKQALEKKHFSTVMTTPLATITPLSDILAYEGPSTIFRCRVKVVDHLPKLLVNFSRPVCAECRARLALPKRTCMQCQASSTFTFMFSLTLADNSGFLSVACFGPSAEMFFNAIAPCDLHENTESYNVLRACLARLWDLEGERPSITIRNARDFDCCVETYSAMEDTAVVRRYRIVNTAVSYSEASL